MKKSISLPAKEIVSDDDTAVEAEEKIVEGYVDYFNIFNNYL